MRGAWLGSASQAQSGQAEDMRDLMFGSLDQHIQDEYNKCLVGCTSICCIEL
jgi:hypothetical protein